MKRFRDWERRLVEHLRDVKDEPFTWGQHDCATLAAGSVDAMCGTTIADVFSGHYADEEEAVAHLATLGASTLADAAGPLLGERIAPARAQRGDVVWIPPHRLISTLPMGLLGVVFDGVVVRAPAGLRVFDQMAAVRIGAAAFSVGGR